MMFSGGDFDDALDVVDVWLYAQPQSPVPAVNPFDVQETVY